MTEVVTAVHEALDNLFWSMGGVGLGIAGTAAYARATGQTIDFSHLWPHPYRNRFPKKIR